MQIRRYADLNRYHVSTMAYLAEELKSIRDGDGTLLDHTVIMHGTNMGNSNQHQHYDVPHFLIGGRTGGKLKETGTWRTRARRPDRQSAAQRAGSSTGSRRTSRATARAARRGSST